MYMMTTSHFPLYKTESNATPILQLYTTLCPEDRRDILRKNGNEVEIWAVETLQIPTTNYSSRLRIKSP